MNLSEKIFQLFITYTLENLEISLENQMRIDHYMNDTLDYKEDGIIDFFMKLISNDSRTYNQAYFNEYAKRKLV